MRIAERTRRVRRVDVGEHLQRRLERHQRGVRVGLVRADRDVRPAHRQRVHRGQLRLLVAVVLLPHPPQLVIRVALRQPEALDVEALLEGVDDQLRPRDDDLLQPVAQLRGDLRVHVRPRRAQLVLVFRARSNGRSYGARSAAG
jgi:hypothetical protein